MSLYFSLNRPYTASRTCRLYTSDYLPYYRFLVELPQEHFGHNNGTKTYGAYYVPAVNMAYLPDVTLWNGTFNQ